ncbi:MAG: hypothetical protein ACHP9S_06580 [Terriglobales bacterium]
MDTFELQESIKRVLEAHRKGSRNENDTTENLKRIAVLLKPEQAQEFYNYLRLVLLHKIATPIKVSQPPGGRTDNTIFIIIQVLVALGHADRIFPELFGHLHPESSQSVENWVEFVIPALVTAIYQQSDSMRQSTLESVKGFCSLYTASYRRELLGNEPPRLLAERLRNIESAIEEVEFRRFERSLREITSQPTQLPAPGAPETEHRAYLNSLINDNAVVSAIEDAHSYLECDGDQFSGQKAAALLRASIDRTHWTVVTRLAKLRSTEPPTGSETSDGKRREYMRIVNFITPAEEKFFSAIYSLISEEGVHQLLAPRETVALLEHTVTQYLTLLLRRLSELEGRETATNTG